MSELSKKSSHIAQTIAQFKVFGGQCKNNLPKKPMSGNRIHGPLVSCFPLPSGVKVNFVNTPSEPAGGNPSDPHFSNHCCAVRWPISRPYDSKAAL